MNRLLLVLVLAASVLSAQKSVLGTLTDFRAKSLEFVLQPDSGGVLSFKVSPDTQVVRIPPGEQDLSKATPVSVTDLAIGDRLLVTFVAGMAEPRRIVRISPVDIERRNQAERLDWQQRGISGIVTGKTDNEIAVELRSLQGAQTIRIGATSKTVIRRYAPDSVKFSDARISSLAEISPGDQLRARGNKTEDGSRLTADDIVFGTFLTILGPITAVNREAGEVHIRDLTANVPVTIRLTADSRLKKMPDMREMFAHMMGSKDAAPAPPQGSIAQMLEALPACTIDDLKTGTTIVATATRGERTDAVTAIMLVANIDAMIRMAQSQPGGESLSPVEAIANMHHGMLGGGPGGLALPALIP
jgi:hypothetical protein